MAFNAETYRLNCFIKDRQRHMAIARALKARIDIGEASDREIELAYPSAIRSARAFNRLVISQRIVCNLTKPRRKAR